MLRFFKTTLLLLFLVAACAATPLTFNGYPMGFNDGVHYVGIASATLNGENIPVWCVDSIHHITDYSWDVNVVNLATGSSELNGLLSGVGLQEYRAMFLLGKQFTNTNPATDVNLQYIIWSFGDPSNHPLSASQQILKNDTMAAVGGFEFSQAFVLVPTQGVGQVLETGTANAVPEPGTAFLLIVGAFALAGRRFCRRKVF